METLNTNGWGILTSQGLSRFQCGSGMTLSANHNLCILVTSTFNSQLLLMMFWKADSHILGVARDVGRLSATHVVSYVDDCSFLKKHGSFHGICLGGDIWQSFWNRQPPWSCKKQHHWFDGRGVLCQWVILLLGVLLSWLSTPHWFYWAWNTTWKFKQTALLHVQICFVSVWIYKSPESVSTTVSHCHQKQTDGFSL